MGFPATVRERALVASARHCCVCHRYKGVKVEVHHIAPEASGGTDDFDNAIVLCFDCHADAGHYNAEHPRGTKFSRRELMRQRDVWYNIVKTDNVASAPLSPLHTRYLVCKSFDLIREIALGNPEKIPLVQPHFVKSPPGDFLQSVVRTHPADHRNDQEWGDHFATVADYLKAHPHVAARERLNVNQLPYFEAIRQPSKEELFKRVAPVDGITRMLLEADVPAEDIAYALAYSEHCGEDRFQEVYRLRPLWAVYLAMTNMADTPITLDALIYNVIVPSGLGYRPFLTPQTQDIAAHSLPRPSLASGTSAVIPVAALLGPLWPDRFDALWTESTDLDTSQRQSLSHGDLSSAGRTTSVIGPAIWPLAIRFTHDAMQMDHQVHELDLKNVYTLSRYWECGSCPHLFLETSARKLTYFSELFAKVPGNSQEHVVTVPSGVTALVLAELEDEITVIERIDINGRREHEHVILTKGDTLRIKVGSGDRCTFLGYYQGATNRSTAPWRRNEIVETFIRSTI